jgi:hypothetical protein
MAILTPRASRGPGLAFERLRPGASIDLGVAIESLRNIGIHTFSLEPKEKPNSYAGKRRTSTTGIRKYLAKRYVLTVPAYRHTDKHAYKAVPGRAHWSFVRRTNYSHSPRGPIPFVAPCLKTPETRARRHRIQRGPGRNWRMPSVHSLGGSG